MALDPAVERQRLGDLDHLPIGKGKIGAAPARMHVELDLAQFLRAAAFMRRFRDQPIAQELFLAAEKDVLRHGEARQNRLLLEHHGDALVEGIARRGDPVPAPR